MSYIAWWHWWILAAILWGAERLLSWHHGRFRRRHVRMLTVDSLFDAVSRGHITSDEAAREIVRRREARR